ncbi:MAG: RagB/SusD family nutrient uptake outer membrane protein [Tannerella sp.]|jgi:hypothetical protein|nr:RagB/SusD family nutrient uptake outer membrane protein [Tannerella sp.]
MKSIYKILIALIALCPVASCDYLDVVPDNIATIDHAFSDRYAAEQYLATCYWGMPKAAGWNENPAMFGALELCFNKENSTTGGMMFGLGKDSPALCYINYWGGPGTYIRTLYGGIHECNTFLENIESVRDLNRYERERWIAEVKMIKAYMHFYLTIYYGPMCPLKENLPINESTRGIRVYRQKIDDCFAYALELINEVIDSDALPLIIDNRLTELGRFTKAAAYTLKAKMLIYHASPLFNGNTDYNSFLNENGEPFFNQTYDPSRWQKAAEACKEAIDICTASGIRLYQIPDYVTAKPQCDSIRIVNALRSIVSERWNCEFIWGNTSYPTNSGLQSPCLPRLEQATSQSTTGMMSVPHHVVDRFYSKNGVPIEEDINYDYANRFDVRIGDDDHRYYIQRGEYTAAMNFDREARFYATLGFDRGKWYGNHYSNEPEDNSQCLYPRNRFNEFSSVFNPGTYNATGYWPKKIVSINTAYRDPNQVAYETYPFPELRFADLLLFYAEALNETKDAPDADVYQYVDMVRERAGLKGIIESWATHSNRPNKPSTKEGMREIIQRERMVEFACEGVYYWDSHRWKTAVREQNRPIQGWDVSKSELQDYYTVNTLYLQEFTYKQYFAPIPEGDLLRNPLLVQNPGW